MQILNPDEADKLSKQFTAGRINENTERGNIFIFHFSGSGDRDLALLKIEANKSKVDMLLAEFNAECDGVTHEEPYDDYHDFDYFINFILGKGIYCEVLFWFGYLEY